MSYYILYQLKLIDIFKDVHFSDKDLNDNICKIGISSVIKIYGNSLDFGMFLSTIKWYRYSYLDLVYESDLDDYCKLNSVKFLSNFFDKIEVTASTEWGKKTESEIKFNSLAEITSALIFIYDTDNSITYVNDACEKLLGYSRDELLTMKMPDLLHDNSKNSLPVNVKSNSPYVESNTTYQLMLKSKSGETKWVEFNMGIIKFRDKNLKLAVAVDITSRMKVAQKLSNSENKYKKLVSLMPDAVYVLENNKFTFANTACANLLGCSSPCNVVGKYVSDFVRTTKDFESLYRQQNDRLAREGSLLAMNQKFIRLKDNNLLELETSSAIVPYEDGKEVLAVSRNISDRQKVERLQAKVKQKTQLLNQTLEYDKLRVEFFANISHELRTPINVIFCTLQLLDVLCKNSVVGENKDKIHKYKNIMKQNCYRLIKLVNNLIDITKIDSGYFNVNMRNLNIINIIEDITLSVAEYIESKNINLIFDTDIEEKFIACDSDLIERIILNLLSNSIKFTKTGGTIWVNIYDKEGSIEISVKDNGIGIPLEKQSTIFQRFIQVDKSLSRNREGSGIGLSLVSSLVKLHNGSIKLKSKVGVGSEFLITLPATTIHHSNIIDSERCREINKDTINIEFSDIYA